MGKIVQIAFNVPVPPQSKIHDVLFHGLNRVIAPEHINKRFSKERWSNVFLTSLKEYFTNLRDVKRFSSSLAFTFGLFENNGCFEANPVDLIALEVLRVFEPGVYSKLPGLKDLIFGSRKPNKQILGPIEDLLKIARKHDAAEGIIRFFFPQTEQTFDGNSYYTASNDSVRELRVCTKEYFDLYFKLSISDDEISQFAIEELSSLAGDRKMLGEKLKEYLDKKRLQQLFERLDVYKQEIPPSHIGEFVVALFDFGDKLPTGRTFDSFDVRTYAGRIVYWGLLSEKNIERRIGILKKALAETVGLFLPVHTIGREAPREADNSSHVALFPGEYFDEFKGLALEIIRKNMSSDLMFGAGLPRLLYTLKKWGDPGEASDWLKQQISNPDKFFLVLDSLVSTTLSSGGYTKVGGFV